MGVPSISSDQWLIRDSECAWRGQEGVDVGDRLVRGEDKRVWMLVIGGESLGLIDWILDC